MKKLRRTKRFIFKKAEYVMDDNSGNTIILEIDYGSGGFVVHKINYGQKGMNDLINEAREVAFDLIKRKRDNNRVDALNGNK